MSKKSLPALQQDTGNKLVTAAVEDTPSQVTSSSQSSAPTAKQRVIQWELRADDASYNLLSRFRKATPGIILENEISTVAKRAVTTNRVGELQKRNSGEQIGKWYPSQGRKDGRDKPKDRSKDSRSLRQPAGLPNGGRANARGTFYTSTFQSQEEFMTNDTNVSTPSPDKSTTNPAPVPKRSASTKALVLQKDDTADFPPTSLATISESYSTDPGLFAHQLYRLRNLVPYLHESKQAFAFLDGIVSSLCPSKAMLHEFTEIECTEAGEFHDFIWPCSRCGCPTNTILGKALSTQKKSYDYDFDLARILFPVLHLWCWRRPSNWEPRLTWPGLILFIAIFLHATDIATYYVPAYVEIGDCPVPVNVGPEFLAVAQSWLFIALPSY